MKKKKLTVSTMIFIGFLILAGVCQMLTRTTNQFLNTVMFSANYLIYAGLLLYWTQSVRTRLLPTRARSYILAAAVFMLLYLTLRVFKYRVSGLSPVPSRYAVYAYWIPQVIIPALFLMACIRMKRGERGDGRSHEAILLIPACALSLLAMTNDLHSLVYRPKVGLDEFAVVTGTYSLGPGFYMMYVWMGLTAAAGFVLLFRETRKRPARVTVTLIGIIALWITLILVRILIFDRITVPGMYQVPEVHIFCMLGVMEMRIRSRLIPYNENHTGFFAQLDLPVLITDRAYEPVYASAQPVEAEKEQLLRSLTAPVYLNDDLRLSGIAIKAGYAFWTEDENELHKENRRLESANELLSEENDLIAVENELKEKQAHLTAQDQVYDRIAQALYPKQKRIEALLDGVEPGSDGFRRALAECCVLNAYSKRKSNLLLLSGDTLPGSNRELFLALQESARFLKCCGIEAAAVGEEYSSLPLSAVHELYDAFEAVLEAYLPYLERMTVSLNDTGIRIALEASDDPDISGLRLSADRVHSDEYTFITIRCAEGGDAP